MRTMNVGKLIELAKKNPTAEAVFHMLAQRERSRGDTDLTRLRRRMTEEGFKVVPEELQAAFKELSATGIGQYIPPKGDAPGRFKWHYDMKSVGRAALEVKGEAPALPKGAVITPGIFIALPNGCEIKVTGRIAVQDLEFVCKILKERAS
jgi:hypothetical protein